MSMKIHKIGDRKVFHHFCFLKMDILEEQPQEILFCDLISYFMYFKICNCWINSNCWELQWRQKWHWSNTLIKFWVAWHQINQHFGKPLASHMWSLLLLSVYITVNQISLDSRLLVFQTVNLKMSLRGCGRLWWTLHCFYFGFFFLCFFHSFNQLKKYKNRIYENS